MLDLSVSKTAKRGESDGLRYVLQTFVRCRRRLLLVRNESSAAQSFKQDEMCSAHSGPAKAAGFIVYYCRIVR